MALVQQNLIPTRTYSPFEGMGEAQRLVTAVPRGMIRFVDATALSAKPVNDDLRIQYTCSLPLGFAYVVSSLSYQLAVDTASDFTASTSFRIFNGVPHAPFSHEMVATFNLVDFTREGGTQQRIMNFGGGTVRDFFPLPLFPPTGAPNMTAILEVGNGADAAQAAGTQFFSLFFYQYELNQAVRFPLNFPRPVGLR